jgi:hypothetical protein
VTDLAKYIPKTFRENLEWRLRVRKRAEKDVGFQAAMLAACKRDILFWMNAWCYCYEPRPKVIDGVQQPKTLPFITWKHQDPVITTLREHLGHCDIGIEKSRGEGMSWILILLALHDWLFDPQSKVGLVSRTEDEADDPDNSDSLMWKCLGVETPVLCDDGWRPLSAIRPGDMVIGSSGKPVKVLGVVPPHEAELFRVVFSDGVEVKCTGDHRFLVTEKWQRQSLRRLYNPRTPSLKTVEEMRHNLRGKKHWNYQVQSLCGVDYGDRTLPLDPYVMGAILGDGCLSKTSVEIASVDEEITDRMSVNLRGVSEVRQWSGISWGLSGGNVSNIVRGLGLRGKRAWEKFIPDSYMLSTRKSRLELLRGLMDTDGSVHEKSGYAVFYTSSPEMADDVCELVRSLGGASKISCYKSQYSYKGEKRVGRPGFRVSVSLPEGNPFHLSRKSERYKERSQTPERRIVAIEPCGRGMVSCLNVDADDHLFVIDGYILTHNCDWELSKLPPWMAGKKGVDWERNLSKHSLTNLRNGAQINADAATGNVFRGGRLKWAGMDEFAFFAKGQDSFALASSQGATNSRLFISTVNGTGNEYHQIMHEPSNMVRVVMDWRDNETRNRGLYRFMDGKPVATDPAHNPLQPDYNPPSPGVLDLFSRLRRKGFKLEGKVRSQWYDHECDRPGATPQRVAQELDRDYGGSMAKIFGHEFTAKVEADVRQPLRKGDISYNPETLEPLFDSKDHGQLHLWLPLDLNLKPPNRPYVIGADISTGLGGSFTSNSVASVIDQTTNEQVLEFASNTMPPTDFADFCIALAIWLHNAYLAWEANGPGEAFTSQIKKRKYGNLYHRTILGKRGRNRTKELGWYTNTKSKERLFHDIDNYVRCSGLKVRSEALSKEFAQYVMIGGEIKHVLAASTDDQSSMGRAHGDRVIAFGVAVQALRDRPVTDSLSAKVGPQNPPPNSIAARNLEELEAKRRSESGWDDRDNADLAAGRG